jgi:hypothetical protein
LLGPPLWLDVPTPWENLVEALGAQGHEEQEAHGERRPTFPAAEPAEAQAALRVAV